MRLFLTGPNPAGAKEESGGVARLGLEPRPYRDESLRAIARGRAIACTTGALEAIFDLRDARAAARARAAVVAHFLDGVRASTDGSIELTVTDGMAETDDHASAPNLKMPFNDSFVKGDQNTDPRGGSFPPRK